jgi:transposase
MLRQMDRSTIHYLHHKGWTNVQIAEFLGHHRDTIARALREPVDRAPAPRQRPSAVAVFDPQLRLWIEQRVPVTRMLELARTDPDHPYAGGPTAFFDYIRKLRRALSAQPPEVALRFEGLPGEFLQIDWGEQRDFPFTSHSLQGVTRYFFAARLKYSRFMFVRFTTDMREETLLRALIACFQALGGVPWCVVTDNMKTAVLDRDAQGRPLWHPAYARAAAEFGFHPEACTPGAPNQKGSVENLVKFVQTSFLAGRSFHDDADLDAERQSWLEQVNTARLSAATHEVPARLLAREQPKFGVLPPQAADYGFFESFVVNRESLITWETNRYSVPTPYVGQVVTGRIYAQRLELFVGAELVATHRRHPGRHARIIEPAHFAEAVARKPRGRVMLYRDWLVALSPVVADYMSVICRKRRADMHAQVLDLYDLAQQVGVADFRSAVELAAERQLYGGEYVRAIAQLPVPIPPHYAAESGPPPRNSPQRSLERDLAAYEVYVANRSALVGEGGR